MKPGHHLLLLTAAALLLVAAAWQASTQTGAAQTLRAIGVSLVTRPVAAAAFDNCPVTRPPDPPFTPPPPYPPAAPYGGDFWYGSQALWLALPADGRWAQLARGEKLFWWREGFAGYEEPQPELSVSARRLDGPAATVHAGPPATNAYHPDFHWAMLTGLTVSSAGCWELTGRYQGHELSFVVWVGP